MKTITFTFFLCFFICALSFPQQQKASIHEALQERKQIKLEIPESPLSLEQNKKCFSLSNFTPNGTQIDSFICEMYDTNSNTWIYEYVGVMYYNTKGSIMANVDFIWDGIQWLRQDSVYYFYDTNGSVIKVDTYTYNEISSSWILSSQETITYDENNNEILKVYYSDWNGSEWNYGWKDSSVYNSNDFRIEKYYFQLSGLIWVESYKYTFSYNTDNLLSEYINYYWNGASWQNSYRVTYSYNSHGNMIEFMSYYWDGILWVPTYQAFYTYGSNNQQQAYYTYYWDGTNWMLTTYDSIAYNANGLIEDEYYYYYWYDSLYYGYWYTYEYNAENMLTEMEALTWAGAGWQHYYLYNINYFPQGGTQYVYSLWNGSDWYYYTRCTTTYNPFTNIADLVPNVKSTIYPNPMKDFSTLTMEGYIGKIYEVLLYDADGKKVYRNSSPSNTNTIIIERGSLKAGAYYYELRDKKTTISEGKLIIAD